jgi:hypothetical protein
MFLLPDAIWYFENRFACELGRPFKTVDVEGLNKYVTLDVRASDVSYRASAMINACGHIADVMAWTLGRKKPQLFWRLKTKIDDYPHLGLMRTRIFVPGCEDYSSKATRDWVAACPPLLVYTRSKDLLPLLTFKESTPGALPPVVDLDPDPDPPICG